MRENGKGMEEGEGINLVIWRVGKGMEGKVMEKSGKLKERRKSIN